MKTSLEENIANNINNNNSFNSRDSNLISNNMLSDSNIELNLDEYKNKDLRCLNCYLIPFISLNYPSNIIEEEIEYILSRDSLI